MKIHFNKMLYRIIVPALALAFVACSGGEEDRSQNGADSVDEGDVSVWLTTGNKLALLSKQKSINFHVESADVIIQVNPDEKYQSIEGFGAALTGSSAYLIMQTLNETNREALLNELFDPDSGIGISNLRITIGASDFSLSSYSYCDEPGIEHFSVPFTDQRDLIPLLKRIREISPGVRIVASPWSPPAWMKISNSMNGGSLKQANFTDYSSYLVMYLQAYARAGIPVNAITIQNEPLYQTKSYPTMYMSWEDENAFIRDYFGPQLADSLIDTQIWIYDHNWDNYQYPINILNDPVTRNYVEGAAFHAYAGEVSAMSLVHDAYPGKGLYFTEISGGGWSTDFWSNVRWFTSAIFMGTVKNWSKNAILWNLALDASDGPKNGGCQNCRGVVTIDGQTITRNEEYYALAHFSRFVRPGAYRIGVTPQSGNLDWVGFMNSDGTKVLTVVNTSSTFTRIYVKSPSGNFPYGLQGDALVTFVWQ